MNKYPFSRQFVHGFKETLQIGTHGTFPNNGNMPVTHTESFDGPALVGKRVFGVVQGEIHHDFESRVRHGGQFFFGRLAGRGDEIRQAAVVVDSL